jgi:type IX secretion system PorP/SprF family membrane protein
MKKYISIIYLLFIGVTIEAFGQQMPQFTQYQLNDFIMNPAVAGSKPYFEAKSNNRYQWEGITDAPRTFTLGVNGPLKKENMGIGGYIFVDVTGPTKRTGFNLAYAYHIQLGTDIKLSLAANAGVVQYTLDGSEITLENNNDDAFNNSLQSTLKPDIGFSFYLYGKNFYFGGSAPQLVKSDLKYEDTPIRSGKIADHYFLMAGYKYDINDKFTLDPGAVLRYVKPLPLQYEFTIKATYNDMLWAGFSYRKTDALALLVGYTMNNTLSIGYSYDFIQSSIAKYSTGSHELMIGIRFNETGVKREVVE